MQQTCVSSNLSRRSAACLAFSSTFVPISVHMESVSGMSRKPVTICGGYDGSASKWKGENPATIESKTDHSQSWLACFDQYASSDHTKDSRRCQPLLARIGGCVTTEALPSMENGSTLTCCHGRVQRVWAKGPSRPRRAWRRRRAWKWCEGAGNEQCLCARS